MPRPAKLFVSQAAEPLPRLRTGLASQALRLEAQRSRRLHGSGTDRMPAGTMLAARLAAKNDPMNHQGRRRSLSAARGRRRSLDFDDGKPSRFRAARPMQTGSTAGDTP